MYKLCIWENMASPHQSHFFKALAEKSGVDLQVRYFDRFEEKRLHLGWKHEIHLPHYEQYVDPNTKSALASLNDWKERIHLVPGNSCDFTKELIVTLSKEGVEWAHWSERSGVRVMKILEYNVIAFEILYPLLTKVLKRKYAKILNQNALGVFGQGKLALDDFRNWGVKEEKLAPLFYTIGPIDFDKMQTPEEFKRNESFKTFLYVGSLTKRKGVRYLIEAFTSLKNAGDWRLLIVGDGEERSTLEFLTKKLDIDGRVDFLGARPIETIPHYMNAAEVFVLPTLFDGWGAVLNEACAVGCAVISTDQCGSAWHLIEPERNGYRVRAKNASALSQAMQNYVDDPSLAEVHGKNSKELYENGFTPEKNAERCLYHLERWTSLKAGNNHGNEVMGSRMINHKKHTL